MNLVVLCSQGHDSTLGFVKNINQPMAEDSVLVQVLKRQGAIPFVKTNVPQSLIRYVSGPGAPSPFLQEQQFSLSPLQRGFLSSLILTSHLFFKNNPQSTSLASLSFKATQNDHSFWFEIKQEKRRIIAALLSCAGWF